MITETTGLVTPSAENIPGALIERPQWVCWCLEERKGEMTKVPYTPGTRRRASSTDLMTWRTFKEALEAYEASEPMSYDGVGFVFCSADPFVGIDLDHCRDPESSVITPWAQNIIARVKDGHVEASPSGTGVHIIIEGTARDGKTRKDVHVQGEVAGRVEMYGRGKFFTMTGETL